METYQIQPDAALYFLTFSVIQWLPVFINEETCLIITESLNFCHRQKELGINAFVIMPTHLHLIVFDRDNNSDRLGRTLTEMRKFTGHRLADYCDQNMPPIFGQAMRETARNDRERQFWQQSRHPEAIFSQKFWQTKINYLHDNPRRKGLVHDVRGWRFSSAAYWLSDPRGESDVELTAVEW
jgi:REP element-mobilizing transposase RayT